jgi:hypothetical protein
METFNFLPVLFCFHKCEQVLLRIIALIKEFRQSAMNFIFISSEIVSISYALNLSITVIFYIENKNKISTEIILIRNIQLKRK